MISKKLEKAIRENKRKYVLIILLSVTLLVLVWKASFPVVTKSNENNRIEVEQKFLQELDDSRINEEKTSDPIKKSSYSSNVVVALPRRQYFYIAWGDNNNDPVKIGGLVFKPPILFICMTSDCFEQASKFMPTKTWSDTEETREDTLAQTIEHIRLDDRDIYIIEVVYLSFGGNISDYELYQLKPMDEQIAKVPERIKSGKKEHVP